MTCLSCRARADQHYRGTSALPSYHDSHLHCARQKRRPSGQLHRLCVLPETVHLLLQGACSTSYLLRRAEEDAETRLDASVKRVVQQNRRAAQEVQLHIDETALLQQENKILQEERKKLMHVRAAACAPVGLAPTI